MSLNNLAGGFCPSPYKIYRSIQSTSLLFCSALAAAQANAQLADTISEEIVITSSRLPLPLGRLGTSVSVLDEDDIKSYGNQAVAIIMMLRCI